MLTTKTTPEARSDAHRTRWSELDGGRFVAVLGVMCVHFSPTLARYGDWGRWGVNYFFVLSGFLITGLLLSGRARREEGRTTAGGEVRHFFVRRCLRLWPVYFATLAVTWAANVEFARPMLPWNVSFLSNAYIIHVGSWPGVFSHLWTLAVEQQFYLVWPWLVLFAPRRWLGALFTAVVAAGFLFRALAGTTGPAGDLVRWVSLPACIDFFAWGALLALWRARVRHWSRRAGGAGLAIALGGAALLFCAYASRWGAGAPALRDALAGLGWGLASAALIVHCLSDCDSPLRRILRLKPLVYLGSISYGTYLLHNFSHRFGPGLLRHLIGRSYFAHELPHVLYLMTLSIAVSALSWHLLESPINRIRTRL